MAFLKDNYVNYSKWLFPLIPINFFETSLYTKSIFFSIMKTYWFCGLLTLFKWHFKIKLYYEMKKWCKRYRDAVSKIQERSCEFKCLVDTKPLVCLWEIWRAITWDMAAWSGMNQEKGTFSRRTECGIFFMEEASYMKCRFFWPQLL